MTDNQQPSPEATRTCRKCGEEKPLEAFAKVYCQKNRGTQYRQHTCLVCYRAFCAEKERTRRANRPECQRDAGRRYWARHNERLKTNKRRANQRLKDEVYEAYGGYRCRCCGEIEPSMLNIDHINNDGAKHKRTLGLEKRGNSQDKLRTSAPAASTMYIWLRKNGFPPGFQVLCYNCNISKHRNGGVCAHELRGKVQRLGCEPVEAKRPRSAEPLLILKAG